MRPGQVPTEAGGSSAAGPAVVEEVGDSEGEGESTPTAPVIIPPMAPTPPRDDDDEEVPEYTPEDPLAGQHSVQLGGGQHPLLDRLQRQE